MLKNKVIIVTGGAGFLGKEISKAIIESEGIAVVADANFEQAKVVCEEIGGIPISLDITSKESILLVINELMEKYGRIDAVINNAYPRNKNYGRHFEEVEYKDFCENTNLHLGGYFLVMQQFSLHFKNQKYGNIINVSSIYGVIAPRFEVYDNTEMTMPVEYAAIKSGIMQLTKYIAKYYKNHNIRCNAISLGGLKAGQPETFIEAYNAFSLNKGMLDPEDITGSIIFLLSEESKYINGQNIIVDDGWTL